MRASSLASTVLCAVPKRIYLAVLVLHLAGRPKYVSINPKNRFSCRTARICIHSTGHICRELAIGIYCIYLERWQRSKLICYSMRAEASAASI